MSLKNKKTRLFLILLFFVALLLFIPRVFQKEKSRPSAFGQYERIEEPDYSEWVRSSRYIRMNDGVELAMDLFRPAAREVAVKAPLPCVWTHARYHRAHLHEGKVISMADRSALVKLLLRYGYVVAVVDVRGGGASFGRYEGVFSPRETEDAYEITEWLARQPWCDGNIGMFGGSYLGITQLMAASVKPPHLKAIVPSMVAFDLFTLIRNGGVYREGFINLWGRLTRKLDTQVAPVPVDADRDGTRAKLAAAGHADNWDVQKQASRVRFRDGETWQTQFARGNPSRFVREINDSGVAVYIWAGFFDIWARDAFQWFVNLSGPKKLTIGTWPHNVWTPATNRESDRLLGIESLRWYDYWLKGIQNGVMDGPSLQYGILHDPDRWTWHATDTWPPDEAQYTSFFFSPGRSGSVNSRNDGGLHPETTAGKSGADVYTVDFSTTSGASSRWSNAAGVPMKYPDMTKMDERGLTYTTSPLKANLTVVGHPIAHIFVSSDREDGDFYLFLEEVDAEGFSRYVSEGWLRASCRETGDAPYDNLGLPYFPVSKEKRKMLKPGQAVELVFDLHPVSNVFNAGHRIRVTLVGADKDNSELYLQDRKPTFRVFRGDSSPSRIRLPVISRPEMTE